MKLIRCYIENFGKLSKYKYEFNDGLNIIKEDNGFGKTTFASFIKAMFYGLEKTNKGDKIERKLYKPWKGGNFGGNIEFKINDKTYKIERFFGNKATEDTFKLYDLNTNLESTDYTENIGEEIFNLNKSSYEKTTYIPQGQIKVQMEDGINAKLGNMVEMENDINTSDEAIKLLDNAKKLYQKRGSKGLLYEQNQILSELQRNLENRKKDEQSFNERIEKLNEINKDLENLQKTKKETEITITKKIEQDRKIAKLETYNNIKNKVKENEDNINNIKSFFKLGIPEDNVLQNYTNKVSDFQKKTIELSHNGLNSDEETRLKMLQNKFDNLTEEDIDNKIMESEKLQDIEKNIQMIQSNCQELEGQMSKSKELNENQNKMSKNFLILGLSLVILGLVIVACFDIFTIGITITIIGIIAFIISIGKYKNINNLDELKFLENELEKSNESIKKLQDEKDKLSSQIDDLLNKYYQNTPTEKIIALTNLKTEISLLNSLYTKKIMSESNFKYITQEIELIKKDLQNFFSNFELKNYEDFSAGLQEIQIRKNELQHVMEELIKNKKMMKEYEENNDIEKLDIIDNLKNINEQDLKSQIDDLENKINILTEEKMQNQNAIEVLENQIDDYQYIELDIDKTSKKIQTYKKKYEILEITKNFLETAKQNFSGNYLKDTVVCFQKYLKLITNKEMKTYIDTNLNVMIEEEGENKDLKYFSLGYKDLVYICMRFSLLESMFKNEKPFAILDDPFVNLDDEKINRALNLLKNFSEEYQIIYFSCHESRI